MSLFFYSAAGSLGLLLVLMVGTNFSDLKFLCFKNENNRVKNMKIVTIYIFEPNVLYSVEMTKTYLFKGELI